MHITHYQQGILIQTADRLVSELNIITTLEAGNNHELQLCFTDQLKTPQGLSEKTRNTREHQLKQCTQNSYNELYLSYCTTLNTLIHVSQNYKPTSIVFIHIQKLLTDKNIF